MFVCDGSFLEFMVKKFKADQSERQSRLDVKKANNRIEFQLDRQLIAGRLILSSAARAASRTRAAAPGTTLPAS